ncbi:hypothetical protein NKH77_06330 [Streptomyces sp. M19]
MPPEGAAALDAIAPDGLPRHPVTLSDRPVLPAGASPHEGRRPLYTLFTSGSTGTPRACGCPTARCARCSSGSGSPAGCPRPRSPSSSPCSPSTSPSRRSSPRCSAAGACGWSSPAGGRTPRSC